MLCCRLTLEFCFLPSPRINISSPIHLTAAEEVNIYSNLSHRTPWCERPSSEHPAHTWWQPTHQGLPRSLVHRSPGLPGPSTSGPCHEDKWEKESFWCLTSPDLSHSVWNSSSMVHHGASSTGVSSYQLYVYYASVCCRNTFFHLPRISHCSASTFYSPLPVPWPGRSHNETFLPRLVKGYRVGSVVPSPSAETTGIWSSCSSIWKCCKIARISELFPRRLAERSKFNHGTWMLTWQVSGNGWQWALGEFEIKCRLLFSIKARCLCSTANSKTITCQSFIFSKCWTLKHAQRIASVCKRKAQANPNPTASSSIAHQGHVHKRLVVSICHCILADLIDVLLQECWDRILPSQPSRPTKTVDKIQHNCTKIR